MSRVGGPRARPKGVKRGGGIRRWTKQLRRRGDFFDWKFRGAPKEPYNEANRNAEKVIDAAKEKAHNSKFPNIHIHDDEKHELFKVAKQMRKANSRCYG